MGRLDAASKHALAQIVRRVAHTYLPSDSGGSATIVLREKELEDRVQRRAATTIQLAWRGRRGWWLGALLRLQAAARRWSAVRRRRELGVERAARWKAARELQNALLRESATRNSEAELARAAVRVQMAVRRWRVRIASARRLAARERAILTTQKCWRRALAVKALRRLMSTPEAMHARALRERKRALRKKLSEQKQRSTSVVQPTSSAPAPRSNMLPAFSTPISANSGQIAVPLGH